MSGTLVLVRHGQSEWNLKNLFTGWRDVDLTEQGREEAKAAGRQAEGARPEIRHRLHLGAAARAEDLPASFSTTLGQSGLKTIRDQALNERDYGDLSGLNKDDARAKWGEEQVHIWRRSYDVPPPGGESLKDTGARVWPYYMHDMQPHVLRGETRAGRRARQFAARADHGARRACRARRSSSWNSRTGVPIVYRLNADSTVKSKEVLG